VVVLGSVGRNFGAGMSGGIAYLLDEQGDLATRVNTQMVATDRLEDPEEMAEVLEMVERHHAYTGSSRAKQVLERWPDVAARFVRVMPKDYARVLACMRRAHEQGLSGEDAVMAAFQENARDLARVGGN
jgi:glutamate synthase (ferredoxin)